MSTNRISEDVSSERVHVQRDSEVEQNQGEPNYGHGERPVAIHRVEQRGHRHIIIGILGRLQLVLEVVRQRDVVPACDALH